MRVLPAHSDPVSGVQFNRDGTMIVSCSWDGYMCVFSSLLLLYRPDRRTQTNLGHCNRSVSQDARRRRQHTSVSLVSSFSISQSDTVPRSNVYFSPNSRFIFASTLDSNVRLWDYQADKAIKNYTGHTNRK